MRAAAPVRGDLPIQWRWSSFIRLFGIDEVRRVPDLLPAIKEAVDRDTSPGRFLLTGSANVLTNRRMKDALTGRMELIRLWPLSQ